MDSCSLSPLLSFHFELSKRANKDFYNCKTFQLVKAIALFSDNDKD